MKKTTKEKKKKIKQRYLRKRRKNIKWFKERKRMQKIWKRCMQKKMKSSRKRKNIIMPNDLKSLPGIPGKVKPRL